MGKNVKVIPHPKVEDQYILIAENEDGEKIAFEVDNPGK